MYANEYAVSIQIHNDASTHVRMFKKAVQQGHSERRGEAYSCRYVEPLSDTITKLAGFFNILVETLAEISKELRKDRELAFYGDVDFIPTEEYSIDEAKRAREGAARVLEIARLVIGAVN